MPHDEGMIGQSADRVLHGAIPHLDYEEPYTGALSWLYAALFKLRAVDLVQIRWLLLAAACIALVLIYALARRSLRPSGAALATWVALVWSFPNYFAGLPSWWLLLCGLVCSWAFVRFVETEQLRYLAVAGLASGVAVTVKQTGLYVVVALASGIAFATAPLLLRRAIALTSAILAAVILAPRILRAEGLYLLVPVLACSVALFFGRDPEAPATPRRNSLVPLVVATAAAALPMLLLLAPYITRNRLGDFVSGAFLLPQKRLAFASMSMPPAWFVVSAAPLVALVVLEPRWRWCARSRFVRISLWAVALVLPVAALVSTGAYQSIWQSTRAVAALLPIGACLWIVTVNRAGPAERNTLFMAASMLAWLSLNQFPFAAPIYFLYTAPLAVAAAVTLADRTGALRRDTMLPWAVLLILFGALSANRGYIQNLGVTHDRRAFDGQLDLPRAHLSVSEGDVHTYRAVVASVGRHLVGGQLVAGPDCPEVYFLAGLVNPSGALFDFFSGDAGEDARRWLTADVIVVNHEPSFTPRLSDDLLAALRREFVHGEDLGRFEVRWR